MELQRVCKASAWSCREMCRKRRPDAHRLALHKTLGSVLSFGGSQEGSPVFTHPINIEILQEFHFAPWLETCCPTLLSTAKQAAKTTLILSSLLYFPVQAVLCCSFHPHAHPTPFPTTSL